MGRTSPVRPLALLGAVTVAAAFLLFACRAGTEPNLADISGTWRYTETFSDVAHSIRCDDVGTYTLLQAGASFVGSYGQSGVCHTPQGDRYNNDSGAVTRGHVVGHTLRFSAPNCEYDGSVDTDSGSSITGRVVCALSDPTQQLNFSGTWQASR